MTAWIIGCGDIGCRLALRLRETGVDTLGFVRSQSSLTRLQRLGISARQIDLDASTPTPLPARPDWLFYSAPPPAHGIEDTRLRHLLALLSPAHAPTRLIYFSTSGVYGDCDGRWVDEHEPLKPAHDRARRRVNAERAIADYAARQGVTAAILRVPGIYGPGRLRADRLRAGNALVRSAESPWSNCVHADDLAEAARLAAIKVTASDLCRSYNIADGHPLTMTDYLQRCAVLLNLPALPQRPLTQIMALASPMQREFLSESKRLRNQRARDELGWHPRTLEVGLASCLQADTVVAAANERG